MSRRALLRRGAAFAAGAVVVPALDACVAASRFAGGGTAHTSASAVYPSPGPAQAGWFAPGEQTPHERTWMAWPARRDIWGRELEGIRHDIASIAKTIVRFEPVALVVRPDQAKACGPAVEVLPMVNDDLWMRDIGPVFLINGKGGLAGLDLNFNGWGDKQVHVNDAQIAGKVLDLAGAHRLAAPFVAEGGALEFDGQGTVMATESSIVNANRNPGKTKDQLDAEIRKVLGAQKVLWAPGVGGRSGSFDTPSTPAAVPCGTISRGSRTRSRPARTATCSSMSMSTGTCATVP